MDLVERHSDKLRFLFGGVANTFLSYIVYLLLQTFIDYRIAYSFAFVFGVVTGYAINTLLVFRQPWSLKGMCAYPVIPILSYALSIISVQILVSNMGMDKRIAPLVITAALVPFTFVLTRRVVVRSRKP